MSTPESQGPKGPPDDRATERVPERPAARIRIRDCVIRVLKGPDQGAIHQFDAASVSVGKGSENDLVLSDPAVSRNHLILRDIPEGYFLKDQGSTNGTFVGGTRVKQALLQPGARIELGGTTLAIEPKEAPAERISTASSYNGILGHSVMMRRLFGLLEVFAGSPLSVVIHGETGTGKELIAKAIHEGSPRRDGPFCVLDCAATDAALLGSALFGHRKGAFTGADTARPGIFATANGGTLFIDEIGELPLEMQPKLLRALEQRTIQPIGADTQLPVDVRVICATHRDLGEMVKKGQFREDLVYRLSGVVVEVPPLRLRVEDIGWLAEHFLRAVRPGCGISEAAKAVLQSHLWPGNVRELKNVMERAAVIAVGDVVQPGDLMLSAAPAGVVATVPTHNLEQLERQAIESALRTTNGHQERAAQILGITSRTLRDKIKRYGLETKRRGNLSGS